MTLPYLHRAIAGSLFVSFSTLSVQAWACGGLFCSAAAPVNQTAERILFAQGDGVTTQIVEILYEGPSERFSWVLPVPGTPDIAVSSKQVLDSLRTATNPQYNLVTSFPDDCAVRGPGGILLAPSAEDSGSKDTPRVTVVDAGSVGPFDYETISVEAADQDPAEVAIRWLEENKYDVGALGADVLRPYLENGLNLLAVRLQKGVPTGSIQPLALTFEGSQPSIPIRPTAVAANDDMGVMVWILGEARAIPENYLGLELNELLLDWTNANGTYNNVVSLAADEAGGKGFVTEFAGASAPFEPQIGGLAPTLKADSYLAMETGDALMQLTQSYRSYDGFARVLSQYASFRDELTAEDFVYCSYCYTQPQYSYVETPNYGETYDPATDPISQTDMAAFLAAMDEEVLQPIRDAAALFKKFPYVTRLYTTMSAGDMDEDPVFNFNADLPDVSNVHTADRRFLTCGGAEYVVTLADGTEIYSDADGNWPYSTTDPEDVRLPANARILAYSTTGPGVVKTDNRSAIDATLVGTERDGGLCAVTSPGRAGSPAWLLSILGVLGSLMHLRRARRGVVLARDAR